MEPTLCLSGGFDPLHIGHLRMFQDAASRGKLTVILNSDAWLLRKKGFCFLPWEQRAAIIGELHSVAAVAAVDDADGTVCEALRRLRPHAFGNGGDRTLSTTPEVALCKEIGIELLWNIGGGKADSSSDIARRAWVPCGGGKVSVLEEGEGGRVSKYILDPHGVLPLPPRPYASHWYVMQSSARVLLAGAEQEAAPGHPPVCVPPGASVQWTNLRDVPLFLIEVQRG